MEEKAGLLDLKRHVQEFWNVHICDYDKGNSFDEIDKHRFMAYPYLLGELEIEKDFDKQILEIGVGVASDACMSIRVAKPKMYVAFDLSPLTIKVAKNHLKTHNSDGNFAPIVGDASNMPFRDGVFDRVKAIGSLHHIPDAEVVLSEIYRVLKIDGDFTFMVYNKDSFRYRHTYAVVSRQRGLPVEQLVREVDREENPYTKAYSKNKIKKMCSHAGLSCRKFRTYELLNGERKKLKILAPFVERFFGWALYVHGRRLE